MPETSATNLVLIPDHLRFVHKPNLRPRRRRQEGRAQCPARPQQRHAYGDPPPDLADLAASLAYGLARNHPFTDGNKRTAHVAYRVFLALNDAELQASAEDKYAAMIGLASGAWDEARFADWLRPRIVASRSGQAQEKRAGYRR